MQVPPTTSSTNITTTNYHVVNTSNMLSIFISLPMRYRYPYALFLDGEAETQRGKGIYLSKISPLIDVRVKFYISLPDPQRLFLANYGA